MKIILILLSVLIFDYFIIAQDFRDTNWGMSEKEVLSSEHFAPTKITSQEILYNESIFDMDCILFYEFYDSSLARAGYIFSEDYNNIKLYIGRFDKLKEVLISKYGKPTNEFKRSNSYNRFINWENEKTKIELILSDVFSVGFKLVYENPELSAKLKSEKESNDKNKF